MVKRIPIRLLLFCVIILLVLPINWGAITGLLLWFSPFLMLNSVLVLKSLVILNIFGFIIIIVVWIKKRWFCNFLCPVGFIFNKMIHYRLHAKKMLFVKLPYFNKWLLLISLGGAIFGFPLFVLFDPLLIFNGFFSLFSQPFHYSLVLLGTVFPVLLLIQFFKPGLWCERVCPLGGLQLILSEIKFSISNSFSGSDKFDLGRRIFLRGSLGALAAIVLSSFVDPNSELVCRPPGSVKNFNNLCLRCGNCIKVCPTQVLIKNYKVGFGLLTPIIHYENSYCLESCNLCSVVCPSGSITLFSIEAKKFLKIGQIEFTRNNCLLIQNKECGVCKQACPYKAIEIIEVAESTLHMLPVINQHFCNGCGACAVVCPQACFTLYHS